MKIHKITEASEYLGVSINTLKTLANNGKIKSFKTSGEHRRFRQDDLDAYMGPVPRRMRCKRKMPHFPRDLVSWLPQLEAAYTGCTMKNMICPHRGLPLVDCEQKDGVVTCPGHGLRWNIATGKLHTMQARNFQ